MRYLVLATDYDGTLAHHGRVDEATFAALDRLRASGRRVMLVTGRELDDLRRVCPRLELFDMIVAENGALLYCPADNSEQVLGEPPPELFVTTLKARGVGPISVGRCIVATWEPHETTTLSVIHELGLELQVIFNKGAVMVLPSGVNKATGLQAALAGAGLSPHNVVGVGDAENDHAFLSMCECGVAVANALPTLKDRADWVTGADHGAGVAELIDALLAHDLAELRPRLTRHQLLLGTAPDGAELRLDPYATNLLVSGSSGSGKSTLAMALLDQLVAQHYQFCIIDPEGDYDTYEHATVLGDSTHEPIMDEILSLLANPAENVVINLLGITLAHRPDFFARLLPRLQELRIKTGHPHWIIVDEAHHMLHTNHTASTLLLPNLPHSMLYVTVHPDQIAPAVLTTVEHLAIVGEAPDDTLHAFLRGIGAQLPYSRAQAVNELESQAAAPTSLERGELLYWQRGMEQTPLRLRGAQPTSEHHRHVRKYAEGDMKDTSFFFQGADKKLNLRAQNLMMFVQIADGVDDETWLYHLRRGDYTHWFRSAVRDDELAEETARIAADEALSPRASRAKIRAAIERRYTAPAA